MKDLFEFLTQEFKSYSGNSEGHDYLEDYDDDEKYNKNLDKLYMEYYGQEDYDDEDENDLDIVEDWEKYGDV